MKYFKNLETIKEYNFDGTKRDIKNLFNKLYLQGLRHETDPTYFTEYTIQEGETPEMVAYKFYGNVDYWWIVCMTNGIEDVFYDWPMTLSDIRAYSDEMLKDYPNDERYNIENLITENDNKRFIRVLRETYLNRLISEYLTNQAINRTTT